MPSPRAVAASVAATLALAVILAAPVLVPGPGTGRAEAAGCRGPVRITRGGTYRGCWVSTSPGTPAVTVATTARVVLDHAWIRHAGRGVVSGVAGVQLRVQDSKLTALRPPNGLRVDQRAIRLVDPAAFVAERNRLIDGMGIWIGSGSARSLRVAPLRVRLNDTSGVGRWGAPACCVQFLQLDTVVAAADVSWNRVTNVAGLSDMEDAVNLYHSGGAGPRALADIHHNLVIGAFARSGNGAGYTGGGIIAGDGGGNYTVIRFNRVVGTSNYGAAIVGGHDNHLIANRLISDGRDTFGRRHGPAYAVGIPLWHPNVRTGPRVSALGNVVGWERASGSRNDLWIQQGVLGVKAGGNQLLRGDVTAATEAAERLAWQRCVSAAHLRLGPGW